MLHFGMACAFEDIGKAHNVGIYICMRMGNRISHPGLRSKIDHRIKIFVGEYGFDSGAISNVHFFEVEGWTFCADDMSIR